MLFVIVAHEQEIRRVRLEGRPALPSNSGGPLPSRRVIVSPGVSPRRRAFSPDRPTLAAPHTATTSEVNVAHRADSRGYLVVRLLRRASRNITWAELIFLRAAGTDNQAARSISGNC